jgi:hypothetical protein
LQQSKPLAGYFSLGCLTGEVHSNNFLGHGGRHT